MESHEVSDHTVPHILHKQNCISGQKLFMSLDRDEKAANACWRRGAYLRCCVTFPHLGALPPGHTRLPFLTGSKNTNSPATNLDCSAINSDLIADWVVGNLLDKMYSQTLPGNMPGKLLD